MLKCLSRHKLSFYVWEHLKNLKVYKEREIIVVFPCWEKLVFFSFLLHIYSHYSLCLMHQANK